MELKRIGDHHYFFALESNKQEKDVFLDCDGAGLSSVDERCISLGFAVMMEKNGQIDRPILIKFKDRLFKVSPKDQAVTAHIFKILGEATNLFCTHKGPKQSFQIEAVRQLDSASLALLQTFSIKEDPRVTVSMPDLMTQESPSVRLTFPPYSDPYTLLSEKSYQQGLEGDFYAHDKPRPSDTCFYFEPKSQQLTLVARKRDWQN